MFVKKLCAFSINCNILQHSKTWLQKRSSISATQRFVNRVLFYIFSITAIECFRGVIVLCISSFIMQIAAMIIVLGCCSIKTGLGSKCCASVDVTLANLPDRNKLWKEICDDSGSSIGFACLPSMRSINRDMARMLYFPFGWRLESRRTKIRYLLISVRYVTGLRSLTIQKSWLLT